MNKVIVITGQTACGKSKYAIDLAKKNNGVIINSDAMQVYKETSILSSCPINYDGIPHKLYGIIHGSEEFSVKHWINLVTLEIEKAISQNLIPIIVGGSPMYNRILVDGINDIPDIPEEIRSLRLNNAQIYEELIKIDPLSKNIDKNNTHRILRAYQVFLATGKSIYDFHSNTKISPLAKYDLEKIIIKIPKEQLYKNCQIRFQGMIEKGAINEVKQLYEKKYPENLNIFKTIGVREIKSYLDGAIPIEKAIELSVTHTKQYAKKQATWFNNKFLDFKIS